MLLANRKHTVGDRRRWIVDYSNWLPEGVWLQSTGFSSLGRTEAVTSDSDTVRVDNTFVNEGKQVGFFLNGGVLNETFTVTIVVIDSRSVIKTDTIKFTVVAP